MFLFASMMALFAHAGCDSWHICYTFMTITQGEIHKMAVIAHSL